MELDLNLQIEKALPSYAQLLEAMKAAILRRTLAPGVRLPDERQLARQFALSRGTVRRALAQLEDEGLVMRQQGRGTFVADPESLPATPLAAIVHDKSFYLTGQGFGARVMMGMVETASQTGAEVFVQDSTPAAPRRAVDPAAAIFLMPMDPAPVKAAARRRPAVSVDYRIDGAGIDSVVFDNRGAGAQAVRHLLAAGHRRIACIDGKLDRNGKLLDEQTALERTAGYRDAMREAGVQNSEEMVWPVSMDTRDVRREFPRLLAAATPRPTAIFAFDDAVALGVWMAAAEMGLRIPQDLSVACCRPAETPDAGGVKWTSVELDARAMGAAAVKAAMERVQSSENPKAPGRTIVIPHRWSDGETCTTYG